MELNQVSVAIWTLGNTYCLHPVRPADASCVFHSRWSLSWFWQRNIFTAARFPFISYVLFSVSHLRSGHSDHFLSTHSSGHFHTTAWRPVVKRAKTQLLQPDSQGREKEDSCIYKAEPNRQECCSSRSQRAAEGSRCSGSERQRWKSEWSTRLLQAASNSDVATCTDCVSFLFWWWFNVSGAATHTHAHNRLSHI